MRFHRLMQPAAVALMDAACLFAQSPADDVLHWNEAAIRHHDAGRFQEAHQAYHRAIEAAERAGAPPVDRLRLQANLASLYLEEGAVQNADRVLRQAVRLARDVPPDSAELAGFYNAVGGVRLIQGNLSAAQDAYDRTLAILDRPGAPPGHELATAVESLSGVQIRRGLYGEARRNLDRAIAILERTEGAHASLLIRALTSLSSLQYLTRDWSGAAATVARALAMAENHYGPNHPAVGDVLQNYALILEKLHRGKEARARRAQAKALLADRPAGTAPLRDATEAQPAGVPVTVRNK